MITEKSVLVLAICVKIFCNLQRKNLLLCFSALFFACFVHFFFVLNYPSILKGMGFGNMKYVRKVNKV